MIFNDCGTLYKYLPSIFHCTHHVVHAILQKYIDQSQKNVMSHTASVLCCCCTYYPENIVFVNNMLRIKNDFTPVTIKVFFANHYYLLSGIVQHSRTRSNEYILINSKPVGLKLLQEKYLPTGD